MAADRAQGCSPRTSPGGFLHPYRLAGARRDDWSPPRSGWSRCADRIAGWPIRRALLPALAQIGGGDPRRRHLTVTSPSWRPDCGNPQTFVEEVLRLEGLDEAAHEKRTKIASLVT